jgi:hypothetical protein
MPIPVACQCGAKFAAKDELAGKAVKCPKCGQPLKIPAAGGAPDAPAAAKKPAGAASPTKTAAPKTPPPKPTPAPVSAVADIFDEIGIAGSKTGIRCPNCNADMQPGAVICITCGFNTQTKKKIETVSDSKTVAKREEIYAKQRAVAELAAKKRMDAGGGSSGSKYAVHGLPWLAEGGSLGSVMATTKMILFSPGYAFGELPPTGGTFMAIGFPAMATFFVALTYGLIYYGMLILGAVAIMANPTPQQNIPTEQIVTVLAMGLVGVLLYAGIAAAVNLVVQPIVGLIIAGVAHPIAKYGGGTELGYGATYRVTMYTLGAILMLSAIPCVGPLIAVVHIFFVYAIGLKHHLRIETGMAALASIVGIFSYFAIVVVAYLAILLPLIALRAAAGQ